jgi:hypothetical protein
VLGTSAEDQQSPGRPPDDTSCADAEILVGDIDEHQSVSQAVSVTGHIDVPHNVLTQPNGTVIIEKLDTPAIRRERFMRRKAEKQRLAEASLSAGSTHREDTPRLEPGLPQTKSVAETAKDGKSQSYDNFEDESDLSELSEDDSQELENEGHEDIQEDLQGKRSTSTQQRKSARKKAIKVEQYPESTIGRSCSLTVCLRTYDGTFSSLGQIWFANHGVVNAFVNRNTNRFLSLVACCRLLRNKPTGP